MTQILWGFLNQAQWLKLYLEIFCAASSESAELRSVMRTNEVSTIGQRAAFSKVLS